MDKKEEDFLKARELAPIQMEKDRLRANIREVANSDLGKVYLVRTDKYPSGISAKQIIEDLKSQNITVTAGIVGIVGGEPEVDAIEVVDLSLDTEKLQSLLDQYKALKKREEDLLADPIL